ncbi:hypothetical protein [Aquisediminimonas sediminicola]|uniref:hypothetical protein n=1 Tax=Alteraquisediminimonas sediminicola TaxID=2676787 RepID=UPI001C8E8A65|nr:hypothetical protein [Aquisediminimonas sediminicola]
MSRQHTPPYLITKDEAGAFRLTVREVRFNSQGYPLVSSKLQDEVFKTANAAKTFAREQFGAEPGQYATK